MCIRDSIAAERLHPGSQEREPNENIPLLWAQSLTWLADLLLGGLITPADLDPSGRRHPRPAGAEEVLVALAPEGEGRRSPSSSVPPACRWRATTGRGPGSPAPGSWPSDWPGWGPTGPSA